MSQELFDTEGAIDLSTLTQDAIADVHSCSGDACDSISISATFNSSGTVRTIKVSSASPNPIEVSMDWSDPFGYCGVTNNGTIQGRSSIEFSAPTAYSPGYCKIRANF
jgi:hypothetical protein